MEKKSLPGFYKICAYTAIRDRFGLVVNWFEWLPSRSNREARSLERRCSIPIRNNAFVLVVTLKIATTIIMISIMQNVGNEVVIIYLIY